MRADVAARKRQIDGFEDEEECTLMCFPVIEPGTPASSWSAARLTESRPEPCEAVARDREHLVHGWFELELPVSAVGLQAQEPDAGNVDGVFAVDPDESEGPKQRRHLADRSYIDKRCTRAQADLGFPTPRPEVVHILGVEHAMLAPGDVNDDTTDRHTDFVTRPGHYAHRLVN